VLAVLAAFLPILDNGFIALFDDNVYVTENPRVLEGLGARGVAWAFTTFHAANWHPLTWLSHMLDVSLFGVDAGRHHAVNLLLHAVNTVLLFAALGRLTGAVWPSAFVAAVFGVHPLHVESVAWIAERKDLLSTLFWALALLAYAGWQRRRSALGYATLLAAYAAGLMAKPMLVSLPVLLLVLDYWPLGRLRPLRGERRHDAAPSAPAAWAPLVREKLPLFALAAFSGVLTLLAQSRGGSVGTLGQIPLLLRLGNALKAWSAYVLETAWPSGLAAYYPHPLENLRAGEVLLAAVFLAGATAAVLRRGRTHPQLLAGWAWFLVTLLPVIGLVQAGSQGMADRYMYVPLAGLSMMAAWGAATLPAHRWPASAALALALAPLLLITRLQVGVWKDSDTVFRHAAEATVGNWLAHYNLGVSAAQRGRPGEAIEQYRQAIVFRPSMAGARINLGALLAEQGRIAEAVEQYSEALRYDPSNVAAHVNLGIDLTDLGRYDEAVLHYQEALRLEPGHAQARANLAWLLARARR
jgi:tetratricopeptide (TPR) repeat protein